MADDQQLEISIALFQQPLSLTQLLLSLANWPSPHAWPYIARNTSITLETPVLLLSVDPHQCFSPDDEDAFEELLQREGLRTFLSRDQLQDVAQAATRTLSSGMPEKHSQTALPPETLLRAALHYWKYDAFAARKDLEP